MIRKGMVRAENPAIRSDSTRPDIRATTAMEQGASPENGGPTLGISALGDSLALEPSALGGPRSARPTGEVGRPPSAALGPQKQLTLAVRRCRSISLRSGRHIRASRQRAVRGRTRLTRRAARARVRRPPLTRSSRPLRSHRRCRRRVPPEADKGRRSALRPRACEAPDRVSSRIREVSPSNCIWASPMRVLFCSSMPLTRVPVLCSACGPVWSHREG